MSVPRKNKLHSSEVITRSHPRCTRMYIRRACLVVIIIPTVIRSESRAEAMICSCCATVSICISHSSSLVLSQLILASPLCAIWFFSPLYNLLAQVLLLGSDKIVFVELIISHTILSLNLSVMAYQFVSCTNTFHLVSDSHGPRHFLPALPMLFRNVSRETTLSLILHLSSLAPLRR